MVGSNSASLFDDIPPAADSSQTTSKRKVEDGDNDEIKRPRLSTHKCKRLVGLIITVLILVIIQII